MRASEKLWTVSAKQGDRAGQGHHEHLEDGGGAEAAEADGEGPHAFSVGGGGVDDVGVVVAVGREQVTDRADDPTAVAGAVAVVVVILDVGGVVRAGLVVVRPVFSGHALRASS